MLLLENQMANTDGTQIEKECTGGSLLIQAAGTFDGATITLQGNVEGLGWQDLSDETGTVVSITEGIILTINLCKAGLKLRGSVTGAGGSTDVSLAVLI